MSFEPGDWAPLPGMTKLCCEVCQHWFASNGNPQCPECRDGRRKRKRTHRPPDDGPVFDHTPSAARIGRQPREPRL